MTPPRKCPICGKPRQPEHAPFCSARCRDRDLMQWLEGGYALPGAPADPDFPEGETARRGDDGDER